MNSTQGAVMFVALCLIIYLVKSTGVPSLKQARTLGVVALGVFCFGATLAYFSDLPFGELASFQDSYWGGGQLAFLLAYSLVAYALVGVVTAMVRKLRERRR